MIPHVSTAHSHNTSNFSTRSPSNDAHSGSTILMSNASDCGSDGGANVPLKQKTTKAQRRAIQEAQRAAKAAIKGKLFSNQLLDYNSAYHIYAAHFFHLFLTIMLFLLPYLSSSHVLCISTPIFCCVVALISLLLEHKHISLG